MYEYKKLACGVGLVTEKLEHAQAACIGIWVGAGSVCETPLNAGVSHYIEHMFFKGTSSKNAEQLARSIDDLGASVNAFTGKEATCFHIKALTQVFPQAVDILLEMLTDSVFDPKELKRERKVILEEMQMYEDTPDEYILDLTTERVLKGTPLAPAIIGTRRSLRAIDRDAILNYIDQYYRTENMVVSVVGRFDESLLEEQLNRALGKFQGSAPEKPVYEAPAGTGFAARAKDIGQTHIALSIPACSLGSDQFYTQSVVNDILGGSMSSRLFQNIREKRGLAYSVYSVPIAYSSLGMFYIYAGITQGKEKEAIDAIAQELQKLGETGITEAELAVCKQRMKSGYIFGQESMGSRMSVLGKNRLLLGRNYSDEDTMKEIDEVSLENVNGFCRYLSDIRNYSGAIISREKLDLKKLIRQL
ncbi:MAG: insulinase family protein [Firmicutes bacterium]|nr:insulinase family protein [Bacillota bacterium]